MEVRTAGIVSKELQTLGYVVKTGIGKTGVVAVLRNDEGPVVMYRADMDANAAEETTGLPYASTKRVENAIGYEVPVAHLCGHDAHTTRLLALARVIVAKFRPVTGSEDAHMLVHGLDGPKVGFLGIGTAPPAMAEAARKQGKEYPFANHQGTFQVDLDAIPYGAKVASVVVLDLLSNQPDEH